MKGPATVADIERLKRMRWSELQRVALEVGVSLGKVSGAKTRDELRLAILAAQGER